VDGALAGAAQAAKGLDPSHARYAPFWSSLQAMRARVSRIAAALGQPGDEFFLLVDQGSSDLGELRVAWARTGAKNDQVAEQLRIASVSYRALRSHFGREGLRQKQGGALNEAESRQLARLQASERRLAASLRRLRDEARRRRDAATAAELERFRAEAELIAQASANLATYLNALIATSELRGEWQANVPYIRQTAPPAELAAADQTVQDLYVDADIGQVFIADLGNTAENPSGEVAAPAKVQVFQPGEEVQDVAVVVEPILTDDDEAPEPAAEPAKEEPAGEDATAAEPAPEAEDAGEPASAEAPEHPEAPSAPAAAPIPPPIG
jgi:signal transduction histidine kinase